MQKRENRRRSFLYRPKNARKNLTKKILVVILIEISFVIANSFIVNCSDGWRMRVWRNWQTRKIQVLITARLCRFNPCYPHQDKKSTFLQKEQVSAFLLFKILLANTAKVIVIVLISWYNNQAKQNLIFEHFC